LRRNILSWKKFCGDPQAKSWMKMVTTYVEAVMTIMMYQNILALVWTESNSLQKKIKRENLTAQSVVQSSNNSANWYGRKLCALKAMLGVGVPPAIKTNLSFSISNMYGIASWHAATAPMWQKMARKIR
jgi:hypothetical protein